LIAKDVSFDVRNSDFSTDTDISGHGQFRERVLQPWVPEGDSANSVDLNLDASSSDWDQFELNKKLFGVETSWDENIYTTALDKSSKEFKQRAMKAARIAQEIEKGTKGNFHQQEERGYEVDLDEEQRYGAVIRERGGDDKASAGRYIPPGKRGGVKPIEQQKDKENKKDEKENKAKNDHDNKKETIDKDHEPKQATVPLKFPLKRGESSEEMSHYPQIPASPRSPRSPRALSPLMMSPGKDVKV